MGNSIGDNRGESKLTPKQQAFCDYYLQSGNATESALKAGYSKRTSAETGYENLKKPHIQGYIQKIQEEIKSSRIADIREIQEFWSSMLRDDREESKDRLKASELLGKCMGAFLEKQEIRITPSSLGEQLRKLTPEQLEEVLNNV